MAKRARVLFLGLLAITLIPSAMRADLISTIPEYTGSFNDTGPFPLAAVTVGTFSDPAISADDILSATIDGTFGNSVYPNSSGVDVYADGVLVASCPEWPTTLVACNSGASPTTWSFDFPGADFSLLAPGGVVLTAVQTSGNIIQLGQTTLDIQATPEPAYLSLFGPVLAVAAIITLRRKRLSSGPS
jgi:hypothetical protein